MCTADRRICQLFTKIIRQVWLVAVSACTRLSSIASKVTITKKGRHGICNGRNNRKKFHEFKCKLIFRSVRNQRIFRFQDP